MHPLFWDAIKLHPWVALIWAVICCGVGFLVRDLLSERFAADSFHRDVRQLRSRAAYYLRITKGDYLPTSKQAEAARALEDACSIAL